MSALTYAGQTFIFRVDNGVVFRNTYTPDGTGLHYETLEGPTTRPRRPWSGRPLTLKGETIGKAPGKGRCGNRTRTEVPR